jgi:hypothetical protein
MTSPNPFQNRTKPDELTIGQIFSSLTAKQLFAVVSTLVSILVGMFLLAWNLQGQLHAAQLREYESEIAKMRADADKLEKRQRVLEGKTQLLEATAAIQLQALVDKRDPADVFPGLTREPMEDRHFEELLTEYYSLFDRLNLPQDGQAPIVQSIVSRASGASSVLKFLNDPTILFPPRRPQSNKVDSP